MALVVLTVARPAEMAAMMTKPAAQPHPLGHFESPWRVSRRSRPTRTRLVRRRDIRGRVIVSAYLFPRMQVSACMHQQREAVGVAATPARRRVDAYT